LRDTSTEDWRHACEVRHVAAMSEERRADYCKGVERHRGRASAVKLWRDAKAVT